MHPCPCGYYTDPKKACTCSTTRIQQYIGKISGPLLDRIDIHIELPSIKSRVEKARNIQRKRFVIDGIFYNAAMNTKLVKKYCVLDNEAKELLRMAMTELGLSARAYDKVLKISRTIADLAKVE